MMTNYCRSLESVNGDSSHYPQQGFGQASRMQEVENILSCSISSAGIIKKKEGDFICQLVKRK